MYPDPAMYRQGYGSAERKDPGQIRISSDHTTAIATVQIQNSSLHVFLNALQPTENAKYLINRHLYKVHIIKHCNTQNEHSAKLCRKFQSNFPRDNFFRSILQIFSVFLLLVFLVSWQLKFAAVTAIFLLSLYTMLQGVSFSSYSHHCRSIFNEFF